MTKRIALALLLLPEALVLAGQPVCSIDLGPDKTICQGQTVQLNGPPGFPSYSWSTGASTPSITVGTAGTYTCTVTYPTGNMAVNPTFSSGNTGFTSMFNYTLPLTTDGNYWIGTSANLFHNQWQCIGNGPFLMVNAGWQNAGWRFWCQTHPVCPGQTYTISFRAASLAAQGPPLLAVFVNNAFTGDDMQLPSQQGVWQTFTTTWTAPAGVTSADFCVQVSSGHGIGNDFGFDDVSISANVSLSDDVAVSVTPLPVVDLGPDATLCDGDILALDATVPGGTYAWQDGSTAPTYDVTAPGTYSITVTANNCSASDAVAVAYNPLPVLDLGPDLTLCSGQTTVLDATTPGATYAWMDGSSGPTHGVNASGTYGATVTVNGCSAYDEVVVAYNPTPIVDLGPDQQICQGQQVLLDATASGATYLWSDGSTGPTLTADATGTYSVTVTQNGCSASDAMDLLVIPLPAVDLGPDQTVCPGTPIALDATVPGATYAWSTGDATPAITVSAPGTYAVQVTANGCTAGDAMELLNHAPPAFDLGPDQTICAGAAATFSASVPGAAYQWSTGATGSSITVGSAGIYWLDVIQNGCAWRDSVSLSVTPLPAVDLGPDLSLCPGATAVLDATVPGGSYAWSNGAVTPSITVGPGNYSVTATAAGCSASDAIAIAAFPGAQVDLGGDLTLCPGDQVLLDAGQPGATYLWQDGSTGPTYLAQATGTVSVTLTDADGCTASDAIQVTVQAPVPVDLGPDAIICQGDQIMLDATTPGATAYLWSTGATDPSIMVSAPGTYSVTVTQGTCAVSDAIQVQVKPLPVIDLGPDLTLCPGDAATLDASLPGAAYAWSTGATTPTLAVDQGGTYSVTLTSADGCTYTDAVTVVMASPGAIDLGPDVTLCSGETVQFSANLPGAAYLWSTGATASTITVAAAGTYWVVATQGPCTVSDTVAVSVQPAPSVGLPGDQSLCDGESLVLDAAWPGATYQWSTGATTAAITVTDAGTYSVVVDLNGCTATDGLTVDVTVPQPFSLGPDLSLCAGEQATLDPGVPGASLQWSTGSTAGSITVAAAGTYWVQVVQGACTGHDTVQVAVIAPGALDLGPPIQACEGESVVLDAALPNASYAWSTGASTQAIAVTASGMYSVTATVSGCSVSDSVAVTFTPVPAVDIGPDQHICPGATATFTASVPNATYAWQDGSTGPQYSTGAPGPVSVTATVAGCSATDDASVILLPAPVADLGNDTTICASSSLVLSVSQPGATYSWSTGSTAPAITISDAGTYSVSVDLGGCTASASIAVEVFDAGVLDLGPDRMLCPGESATLTAGTGGTCLWSTGAQAGSITVDAPGVYWLQVTQGGCAVSDTVHVEAVPLATPDLGGPRVLCQGDSVVLEVDPDGAAVLWSDGSTGERITVTAAGTYSVTLSLQGCTASDAVQVWVHERITQVSLGPDSTFCPGEPLLLATGLPQAEHQWSTGSTAPSIYVSEPGTYGVHVSGTCIDAQASIRVAEGLCGPYVHVPNAVTPNGDGINDAFRAEYFGPLRDFSLEIFDRWGQRIAFFDDPLQAWDCTVGGQPVPDGVYAWKIRYRAMADEGARAQELFGHVTVLR